VGCILGCRSELIVFEIVTQFAQLYTLCHAEEDTVLLYEILRNLGGCIRGGGVFSPGPFVALKSYMNWFFALTMFGIGAVLQVEDFERIARRPTIILIGSVAQFSIMPLGAFVLAKAL